MSETSPSHLELPEFFPGKVVYQTQHFRVVMDYKPETPKTTKDQRFFIEPRTNEAEEMLKLANQVHNVHNFNTRQVPDLKGIVANRECLRADWDLDNLPNLFVGRVVVPFPEKDSIPSPDRMEKCLELHPDRYTFED